MEAVGNEETMTMADLHSHGLGMRLTARFSAPADFGMRRPTLLTTLPPSASSLSFACSQSEPAVVAAVPELP